MTNNVGKPFQRARNSALRFGLEELKLIRSISDMKIFYQKMVSFTPRLTGMYDVNNPVPPSLQIEPTNWCNAHCLSCPTWNNPRAKGYMDFGLFTKIIDEAAQIGVKRIRLFLHGEPLIHPKIIEMIAYIKSKGLWLNVTTNGIHMDHEIIQSFLNTGLNLGDHFTFSVLGYSKDVHERVMKGVKHEKVLANIIDFRQSRDEKRLNGPIIETIFYSMPENIAEESAYYDFWHGKVDHVRLGGPISESFAEVNQPNQTVIPRTQTCIELWERMTIFWDGRVPLCCQDVNGEWILGDMKTQSIQEVWHSEQIQAIKKIHKEKRFKDFPFCYNCDM